MKKKILFTIFMGYFQIQAQDLPFEFVGKKIESTVSFAKTPILVGVEHERLKMQYTRWIEVKDKKSMVLIVKRIKQKNRSEITTLDIDTDRPFPSNEFEKGALEHYGVHIDKKINIHLDKQTDQSLTQKIWNAQVPMLNTIQELSGIILSHKSNIVDSLRIGNELYINRYILHDSLHTITIEGYSKNVNEIKTYESTHEIPAEGTNLKAETKGKLTSYTLEVNYDIKNNFIYSLKGKITSSETLVILGQKHDRNTSDYILIENKILN